MSIDTDAGIMLGLPYKEMLKYFDENDLNDLIDVGDLGVGSIYYDSPRGENIVGIWLAHPSRMKEVDLKVIIYLSKTLTTNLDIPQLKNAELKTYVTLSIT